MPTVLTDGSGSKQNRLKADKVDATYVSNITESVTLAGMIHFDAFDTSEPGKRGGGKDKAEFVSWYGSSKTYCRRRARKYEQK